jgi:Chromate resistance exported protein
MNSALICSMQNSPMLADRCTFEVLLASAALEDSALEAIAEIVHDIDLKDEKFGRAEVVLPGSLWRKRKMSNGSPAAPRSSMTSRRFLAKNVARLVDRYSTCSRLRY